MSRCFVEQGWSFTPRTKRKIIRAPGKPESWGRMGFEQVLDSNSFNKVDFETLEGKVLRSATDGSGVKREQSRIWETGEKRDTQR